MPTMDQYEKMSRNLDERLNSGELPTANIMVAGCTGSGKSTLLNAVFGSHLAETGIGKPITSKISEYHRDGVPIRIWDTVGLELDSKTTNDSLNNIRSTISKKAESFDQFDRIHAIWYCINSRSNRYQDKEIEFIKSLHSTGVPFIIVITQCIGDVKDIDDFEIAIRKQNRAMKMEDINIVQVLAQPLKIRGLGELPAFGLEELVTDTMKKLPSFIKRGFAAAQRVSKAEKRAVCEEIIRDFVTGAQMGFWDKIGLINIATTNHKIVTMFGKIVSVYNTVIPEESLFKVTKRCGLDGENIFFGLVNPLYGSYKKKITRLLEQKRQEGFSVSLEEFKKRDRAARMIAYYGYIIIDAIEEIWERFTEEQLKSVDLVMDMLIVIINRKLRENIQ